LRDNTGATDRNSAVIDSAQRQIAQMIESMNRVMFEVQEIEALKTR